MRTTLLVTMAVLATGCVLDLEGAPCETDSNCPHQQWCQTDGTCTARVPTVAEACEQVVQTGVTKTVSCYGGRRESWEQELQGTALCQSVAVSEDAETLTFDPAQIRACKAAILDRACEDVSLATIMDGCAMFTPVSGIGGACSGQFDCTEGWCRLGAACPGSCVAYTADDQACTNADKCNPGSACVEGFCRKYRDVSQACSNSLPCDPYLAYCDGNPGTCQAKKLSGGCSLLECAATYRCSPVFIGTCNPARAIGETCSPGGYQCEALARCSDVTNQCEPLSTTGGGCGFDFEGEITGCIGSRCAGSACANFIAPGQPCNNNGECGPLAHCDGVCVRDFCL